MLSIASEETPRQRPSPWRLVPWAILTTLGVPMLACALWPLAELPEVVRRFATAPVMLDPASGAPIRPVWVIVWAVAAILALAGAGSACCVAGEFCRRSRWRAAAWGGLAALLAGAAFLVIVLATAL